MSKIIEINLRNAEGETEKFIQPFVSSLKLRKIFQTFVEIEKKEKDGTYTELDQIDDIVTMVAGIFDDEKVNFNSIYEGLSSSEFMPVLNGIIEDVMGGMGNKK